MAIDPDAGNLSGLIVGASLGGAVVFMIPAALGILQKEDHKYLATGVLAGIVEELTGIVVIPGMAPISEGFTVVADIAMVLAGAFPMVHVLTKVLSKPLAKVGKFLGINEVSVGGMVACLANSVPMFGMVKDMEKRGKVVSLAFATSAAFVFGDHLGFTAGFNAEMIVPMIVSKLVGGVTAVVVALWMVRKEN